MALQPFDGELDQPRGLAPFEGKLDGEFAGHEAVPEATAGSVARDVAAGALKIGPTFLKGVGDVSQLATGGAVGSGLSGSMQRGMDSIDQLVGSERAAAQKRNFERDMADDSVGIGEALARNKGALADQLLPTVGSMFLPVGVAGGAGKLATVGQAAQALDKAALAARVARVQKVAGIGTIAAQNAADTFTEQLEKGASLEDAYISAGITVPFSVVAGAVTGGGAEGQIARNLFNKSAAGKAASELLKAPLREGVQEVGEEAGQILGDAYGARELPSATGAGKRLAVAGTLGAAMGGGAHVATMGRGGAGEERGDGTRPTDDGLQPDGTYKVTITGTGDGQAPAAAPAAADFDYSTYPAYRRALESGGVADAKNPNSSAYGADQFTRGTWLDTVAQAKPEWAVGMSEAELLAQRANPERSAEMATFFDQQNALALRKAGQEVNRHTLYAMHHFGNRGIGFAKAGGDTLMSDILSPAQMEANAYLNGKTKDQAIANWDQRAAGAAPAEQDAPSAQAEPQTDLAAAGEQTSEAALKPSRELTALDRAVALDNEAARLRERLDAVNRGGSDPEPARTLTQRLADIEAEVGAIKADWPPMQVGRAASFTTEAGVRLEGHYALVDASQLITSHDENLRQNPAYPQALQPRQRDRAASEMQISGIVGRLDPTRLGLSADAATGAPIVGADGLVESGNARTIALKRVYQAGGQKAADYKAFLESSANEFGVDPEQVRGMAEPVLVRVRDTPVDRAEFARQANASTVAAMSPSEQAKADAARIDSMEDLTPDDAGDFTNAGSRSFVRRFMGRLPATEQAAMVDASGALSSAGYARVRNAVLAKAYGDSPVIQRMTESLDDNVKNLTKALMMAAPEVAKMRAAMEAGARFDVDITADVVAAVEELARLKDDGISVHDALAQAGMFGDKYSPETRELMQFLADNTRRPRRIADFLKAYYQALDEAGDPNQGSLLGETEAPTKGDLMQAAKRAANDEGEQDATSRSDRAKPPEGGGAQGQESGQQDRGQREAAGGREEGAQDHQGAAGVQAGRVGEWVAFPKEDGSIGIPRAQMPQIKSGDRSAFLQFLQARGIDNEKGSIDAADLKPTQAEFSAKKVERLVRKPEALGDRSVLVSSDGHVLDGHHQWMARRILGQEIPVIQIDAPIRALLDAANEFPSVKRSEGADNVTDLQARRASAVADFKAAMADLADLATKHQRAAMVPEQVPGLVETLAKLFDAAIRIVGTDVRAATKWVRQQLRADKATRKLYAEIDPAILRKAAERAAANMAPASGPAQAGLFDSLEDASAAVQGDLFGPTAQAPQEARIPAARTITSFDQIPRLELFVSVEVLVEAREVASGLKESGETHAISDAERAEAEALMKPRLERAAQAKDDYDAKVREAAKTVGGGYLLAPLKGMSRIVEKLTDPDERDENGNLDPDGIKDLLRSTIVVDDYGDAQAALDAIAERFNVIRVKNRIPDEVRAKFAGYADVLVNIRTDNGTVAEIQINVPSMLAAKNDVGHVLYEVARSPASRQEARDRARELMRGLYDVAYEAGLSRGRTPGLKSLALRTADRNPASDMGAALRSGSRETGFSSSPSSDSLNTLPSGKETNSSPENEATNSQPAGNLSGTFINTSDRDIITGKSTPVDGAAAGNGPESNGITEGGASADSQRDVSPGAQGARPGAVSGAGEGRQAGGARHQDGERRQRRNRAGDDAGRAGAGLPQAAADGADQAQQRGTSRSARARPGRAAGVPVAREIPAKTGRNYSFDNEGDLTYEGSWAQKARANVEAVELLKKLTDEGRQATPEEQAVLAKFIGWGASELANTIFSERWARATEAKASASEGVREALANSGGTLDGKHPSYYRAWSLMPDSKKPATFRYGMPISASDVVLVKPAELRMLELRDRLKKVMTPKEWPHAHPTTQYGHYTSKAVVKSMWDAMERMGFKGGAVLEPGAGIGVFPGLMPAALANNSIYTGVEYDSFTGGILKQLQPDERIVIDGYQNVKLPAGFYDVAIGNPPFADLPVLTDTEYKRHAFSLHDYFFAKTIDRLKPGGLMAFVTSRYTMDKLNDKARSYLADKADLVGAIRLPQTAFKQNAGTEVITDVIFLRKRVEGEQFDQGQNWQKSVPVTVDGQTYNVNEYFVAHPEMVLGTISSRGSMYAANEYTVLPGDKSIDEAFAEAVARLPADIYRPEIGSAAAAAQVREIDFNPKAGKEGNFYVSDAGVLMQRESGQGMRVEGLSASDARIVADYVPLRDALKQAQYDQLNGGDWETSLRALQGAYREFTGKHGRLWQFKTRKRTVTVTDPDTGETFKDTEETRWFPLHKLLRSDPDNTVVLALEKFNYDTSEISDGDMLKGRVLDVTKPPVIETPTDAMLSVLNDVGHVDIDMIADRVGMDAPQVIEALGTAIYQQPGGEWQTADEYLSGNVKEKLRAAREATKSDERFQRNVDALEAVQPLPKGPEDINIALGMNWIRPQEYSNFLRDLTGMDVEVTRSPTGDWLVKALSRPTPEAMSDWGTQDRPADDLLQSALNGSPVRVTKTDPQTKASRVDEAGTEAANAKLQQLQERFSTWVWEDAKRSDAIVRTYNDKFNTTIPRSFDGRHLRLPGTSSLMTIFDHVKRGAWRIIQTGNTYLAHAVGSGKTFQMVISAMEQKRLGLIKKPMMVVPNHMLQQFANEWLQLYPAARLMVADEENFQTDNRRRFVSRVALSDLDGVIITQSAFKLIDTSPEFKAKIVEEQLEFLRASLYEVDQDAWADEKKAKKSRDPTVKQIQRQIERLEERLTAAMEGGKKKDKNILFEELGVDMLYVDEAHGYRKLDFATKRQMKGIQPAGSIAALDLYTKARYLDEKRPGRSIVMASGTPITNTLAELYSVQRFMDRTGLEERGLESFDDWAAQHGRMTTELEPNAAGRYEPVSRFSKFVNLSDLTMAFRKFADVLTSDDLAAVLGDKRPKVAGGGRRLVLTPKTEGYAEYQKELADRMEKSRAWKPSKDEPNNPDPLIRIIGDGRLAAIDMRFVDPQAENDPNSKLNQMADAVIQRLQETADNTYVDKRTGEIEPIKGGTLMVFSDIGFGAGVAKSRGFNGRAWFEKRLRDGGVDMNQVAFMADYKKSRDKLNLFADVNAGKVRLLVGTSKNMGTGVNAQQRLTGVFHLDPTWYPADIEQREGRAVRQGNKNKEVDLVAFAAKGSYDENMWKMIARKDLFINQIMTNDGSVNEVEDVSVGSDYSVLAAMVAENPKVLELAGAEADMKRMERLYQAHEQGRAAFRERHDSAKLAMEAAQHGMAAAERRAKEAPDLSGDNFVATVGKQKYTSRADWGKALIERFADLSAQATFGAEAIGKIGGFDVTFEGYKVAGGGYNADVSMKLPLERSGRVTLVSSQGDSPVGAAMRAQNAIAELRRVPEKMRETIEQSKATMESLRTRLDAPFPMAQMLVDARANVKRLREELAAEGEPDAGGEPGGQVKASRQAAARGAKVTAIRAALRKAYGRLVDGLEQNGVVTLTQTMDEAVEAAAQARAAKTGQSVERARARLQSSIRGDADELSMSIYSDEAGKIERALEAMGLQVSTEGSRISQSTYVIVESPEYTQTEGESGSVLKIRVSDHRLPGGYQQPDFEVQVGEPHQGVDMADAAGAWFDAVRWVGRRFGVEPKGAAKRQIAAAAEKEAKAKQAAAAAADQQRNSLEASKARLQAWLQSLPDGALWGNARRGGWVAVLDSKIIGRFDGETATGEGQPWYGGPYPVEAQKNLQPVRESLRASVKNSVADQTQTEAFERWFKDSKVVDAEGKPLVVYRGGPTEDWQSGAEITEFRSSNGPWAGFFTNSSETASRFANAQYALTRHGGKPAGVFPVYLSMQKPLEVDAGGKPARDFQIDASVLGKQDHPLRERMLNGDYDGLILRNTEDEGDVFVPLNPEQIKSATGNQGNFDPNDADIRRSANGAIEGFHDPVSGKSFLIADALTEQTAPGTLMHEVGVHMAEQGALARMIRRGEQLRADSPRAPVVRDAIRRMDEAGETSGEEFVAYLVTEYENQRAAAPRAVRQFIVDLLAAARAWLHSKGWVDADRLTVADLAAIARANARAAAKGRALGAEATAVAFQRAWHGTPHRGIEQAGFKLNRIGTGEGAQAYGWGIYFASNRDVAEVYRTRLSPRLHAKLDGADAPSNLASIVERIATEMLPRRTFTGTRPSRTQDEAIDSLVSKFKRNIELSRGSDEFVAMNEGLIELAESLRGRTITPAVEGQLYNVEIPEDSDLLDWDKPLSRQPDEVKRILRESGLLKQHREFNNDPRTRISDKGKDGQSLYHMLVAQTGSPRAASERLGAAGIPGLRYLDGDSRAQGRGSHNYVIWDEALLTPEKAQIEPVFSRSEGTKAAAPALNAEQRAQDIIDDKVKAVRPLEALTRAVTRYTGIEALTRGAGRLTARALDRMTPETIKAGLVSDFGVPEDAINARVLKQGRILMQMRKTGTLLERLATMTNAEAELAYAWMTGESPTAAMDAIAKLPAEQVRVLQEFRETVDKLGQDAVDAGLLSERTYRRNRGAYLHRSYEKHVLDEAAGKPRRGGRRATAVLGQNLHRRGIDITADMAAVRQTAPEWWDIARKAGKADPDLIGRKLIRLQRRANAGEGTLPLEGMDGRGAGRVLEAAYLPADKPIPAKYADWTHAGEWEVRDVRGQELGLWRDYTLEERKRMGEIRDVRFAIAKTMQGMVQDVETARYFSWVAKNYAKPKGSTIEGSVAQASEGLLRAFGRDEWVQVPETKVPGTDASKYGALAGKFVPGPIWNDIRHQARHGLVANNVLGRGWDFTMRLFKTSKTAWSPTVHVNNIMSNFVMMDWNDVSAQHVAKAMGILMAAHDRRGVGAIGRAGNALARGLGIADRDAASEIVARFKESGGELGNWVVNETVKKALEGPLAQLQKDLADDPNGAGAQIGVMAALQHLKEGRLGDGGRALWGSKPVAVTRQELGNMTELYNSEDSVFRLAAWLQAKEEGKSDIEAGKVARRAFMDYEINAPWIQLAKNTGLPFLSFTYRGLPLLLTTMSRKPHKIVKLMAIFGALNQLGLMLAGGDDDDEVRRLLPDEKAGGLWGLVPKLIRMPLNDANDSPVYLDVRRWVPLGDIVDVGQGHAALPIPPSLMPGGPLAVIGELWANKSAFTGKPITLETDTPAEAAKKVALHLYRAFMPNIVGLPGTYASANVANAIKGKTDTFGREQSVPMALAGSFGVKLGAYPTDTLRRNTALGADIKTREIKAGIRAIQRQVQLGGLSAEDGQKQVDAQVRKIERLREKTLEKMGTD